MPPELKRMKTVLKSTKLNNVLYDVRGPIVDAARQMEETIVSLLATIFAHATRRTVEDARVRYEGQCQMLVMLVKAMATRTAQFGPASPALASQVVGMIDGILTDISNDKAEG